MTAKQKRRTILEIINPLPGAATEISLYHAERLIKRGVARLERNGTALRITPNRPEVIDHRREQLAYAARQTAVGYLEASVTGMASMEDLRHTPVLMPERLLIRRKAAACA